MFEMVYRVFDSSSLGAVIVAGMLAELGEEDVRLVRREPFMASWEPIQVGGVRLNNGYHVFEMPRSKELVGFLADFTGMSPRVEGKRVFLQIDGYLVDSNLSLAEWPQELEQKFGISSLLGQSPETFDQNNSFVNYLKDISHRFGDNWEDSSHLFFPFFFPTDFLVNDPSSDEGDSFRAWARTESTPEVAVFGDGTMADLRQNIVRSLNLREFWDQEADEKPIQKPTVQTSVGAADGDRTFTIALVESKQALKFDFGPWDEILVADSRFGNLNRVWFPLENDRRVIACEIYSRIESSHLDSDAIKNLFLVLSGCTGVEPEDFVLMGFEPTRKINVKKLKQMKLWEQEYAVDWKDDICEIKIKSFGTANMNKVWLAAIRAVERATTNA
jgi:hypothetical protein